MAQRGLYRGYEGEEYEDEFEWAYTKYPIRVVLVNGRDYQVRVVMIGEKWLLANDLQSKRQVIINKSAIAAIEVLRQ